MRSTKCVPWACVNPCEIMLHANNIVILQTGMAEKIMLHMSHISSILSNFVKRFKFELRLHFIEILSFLNKNYNTLLNTINSFQTAAAPYNIILPFNCA